MDKSVQMWAQMVRTLCSERWPLFAAVHSNAEMPSDAKWCQVMPRQALAQLLVRERINISIVCSFCVEI